MAMHPAALAVDDLLKDCTVRRQRRSGPGGQHRNKVETAVIIEHTPSGISAEASERRSQEANRQAAVFRLRVKLAVKLRNNVNPDAPPSELWKSRCRSGKVLVNAEHDDFPPLLAEAIDHICSRNWDVKSAAERLGCSTTQLVNLLAKAADSLKLVNAHRAERELPLLRT